MNIIERYRYRFYIRKILRLWQSNGEIFSDWKVKWDKIHSTFKIDVRPTEKMKDVVKHHFPDL